MVDADGLDALSMRKLGQSLGVEAMSLYNHVANKDDLVSGIVDRVAAEFALPDPAGDWREELTRAAASAHQALRTHPWAGFLMMTPEHVGAHRLEFMDAILAVLDASGASAEMVHYAFHALDAHIVGTSLRDVSYTVAPEDEAEMARAFMATLPPGRYPHLIAHIEWHAVAGEAEYTEFEFGLKLILDAVAQDLGA
jgi:AcrR family transcriptional regulator